MMNLAAVTSELALFAEPTRVRLASLLHDAELTVADLTQVLELPQSRVSTHLGKLREAGVLVDRKVGVSTFYSLNQQAMPADVRRVWDLVQGGVKDGVIDRDRERRDLLLRARDKAAAAGWPDAVAGRMEKFYSPGRTWESLARGLLGLARLGDVLDAGSGDGTIAELLAPRARSVTLLDRNEKMIFAAMRRLQRVPNVRAELGDVLAMPFADASFDDVLLFNVLTELEDPPRALAEAARVLRPGGQVTVITLDEHDQPEAAAPFRHVHPGFAPRALRRMLARAGLTVDHCDVTSREKREPHFQVVTAFARKGRPS